MPPKHGPLTRKGRVTKSVIKQSSNLPTTSTTKPNPTDFVTPNPPPASRKTPPFVSLPLAPVALVRNSKLPGPPQAPVDGKNDMSPSYRSLLSAFSNRIECSCTTTKTTNNPSRHNPDPFKSNHCPRNDTTSAAPSPPTKKQ